MNKENLKETFETLRNKEAWKIVSGEMKLTPELVQFYEDEIDWDELSSNSEMHWTETLVKQSWKFSRIEDKDDQEIETKIEKQIEREKMLVDKMIESYNTTGDFNISEIAQDEEEKFREYFREYLCFRGIRLYDGDSDCNNILLLDRDFLMGKNNNTHSTLIETINRIETLIEIYTGDNMMFNFHQPQVKLHRTIRRYFL